jgi:penicillin-insensitive murein endopeptidase
MKKQGYLGGPYRATLALGVTMNLCHKLWIQSILLIVLGIFSVESALAAPTPTKKPAASTSKTPAKTASKTPAKTTAAKKKTTSKKKKKSKRRKRVRPSFPLPVPSDPNTQSIGIPSHGRLYHPTEVPMDGATLMVSPNHKPRRNNYATEALVDTMQYGADAVAQREPTARLIIGDASAAGGGPLGSHSSHQSGLDCDIAFYMRDSQNKLSTKGEFLYFQSTGMSSDGNWRFDAELNWYFVEALLTSPAADIQHIFVANHLKTLLLEAAKKLGANPLLIERASYVMSQPRDSSPHADHFHIRIYCPVSDRFDGCMAHGVIWPWVEGITPTGMAPLATYAISGKDSFAWNVDGGNLGDCDEGDKPSESHGKGEPMDGDYVCADPNEYGDAAFFEVEEGEDDAEDEEENKDPFYIGD